MFELKLTEEDLNALKGLVDLDLRVNGLTSIERSVHVYNLLLLAEKQGNQQGEAIKDSEES